MCIRDSFIHHLEMKLEKTSLKRVDADVLDKLIVKDDAAKHSLSDNEIKKLTDIFDKAINNSSMKVEVENQSADAMPVTITIEELSLIHISEPTRQAEISYAVFCLKKKKKKAK